jgi:hypothetical protein
MSTSCPGCRANNRERMAAWRERKAATPLADNDPRHGTENAYTNFACRCDRCRAAKKAHDAEYRARRKARSL